MMVKHSLAILPKCLARKHDDVNISTEMYTYCGDL